MKPSKKWWKAQQRNCQLKEKTGSKLMGSEFVIFCDELIRVCDDEGCCRLLATDCPTAPRHHQTSPVVETVSTWEEPTRWITLMPQSKHVEGKKLDFAKYISTKIPLFNPIGHHWHQRRCRREWGNSANDITELLEQTIILLASTIIFMVIAIILLMTLFRVKVTWKKLLQCSRSCSNWPSTGTEWESGRKLLGVEIHFENIHLQNPTSNPLSKIPFFKTYSIS